MWLHNFFKSLVSNSSGRRPIRRPRPASRLIGEQLEDRRVLSVIGAGDYLASSGEVVAGDFNGDGYADLAVTHPNSRTIDVRLANADGSLGPSASYAAGEGYAQPLSIAAS